MYKGPPTLQSQLQAGDRLVASGAYGLPDNVKIKVENQDEK